MMKNWFETKFFRITPLNLAFFFLIAISSGFALGTATLLGPVRWITTMARNNGWSETAEDLLVKSTILLLVFVTVWVALHLTRMAVKLTGLRRAGLPGLTMGAAAFSLWIWMNPQHVNSDTTETIVGEDAKFVFGPYPTADKIQELKARGFTAVVPLLHPAVVPFEPQLLEEERGLADAIGLEFIHLPMLPWVSDNEESLARLKTLCGKDGKYYIHCYLGKDRVNVAKRVLTESCASTVLIDDSQTGDRKSFLEGRSMERGEILKVSPHVFITPNPTREELFSMYARGLKHIVIISDDTTGSWERKAMEEYRKLELPFTVAGSGTEGIRTITSLIADPANQPMIMHGFLLSDNGALRVAEALNVNRKRLDRELFKASIQGSEIHQLTPYVASGKLPLKSEYSLLFNFGVRNIMIPPDMPVSENEIQHLRDTGFSVWRTEEKSRGEVLRGGGTWFIVNDKGEAPLTLTIKQDKTING